ncbi:MAG TPA: hypothetical protein DHW71_15585, partial [Gammaproteobacteria bacterium]|nr:hypothetical protein [Gammaproteobacteria bacterium]
MINIDNNFSMRILPSGQLEASVKIAGGQQSNQTYRSDLTDNHWHHVAYSYDGAYGHYLYIDGNLEAQGISAPVTFDGNSGRALIGNDADTNTNLRFRGWLDEVRIYDRFLDEDEIAGLTDFSGHLYWTGEATAPGDYGYSSN